MRSRNAQDKARHRYLKRHPDRVRASQLRYKNSPKGQHVQRLAHERAWNRTRILRFINRARKYGAWTAVAAFLPLSQRDSKTICNQPNELSWKSLERMLSARKYEELRSHPFPADVAEQARWYIIRNS